jgi:hypothetical protein
MKFRDAASDARVKLWPLMADPGVTFALALVGTLTGVTSTAVEVARAVRDRAKVQLQMSSHSSVDPPYGWLSIDVINTGRQALTIREVGLYPGKVRITHKRQSDGQERETVADIVFVFCEEPFVLEAGTLTTFEGHVGEFFNVGLHADSVARPFAIDLGRRWHWGDADPVMRSLINHGFNPPNDVPSNLLEPPEDPPSVPSTTRKGLQGTGKSERLIVRLDCSFPGPASE